MHPDTNYQRRRQFIKTTLGGTAVVTLAGCTDSGGGDGDGGGNNNTPSGVFLPGVYDLSGGSSENGIPYQKGATDAIKYINGEDVLPFDFDHEWVDASYEVPNVKQAYDDFSQNNPPGMIGWGTPSTEALGPRYARDKTVVITAAYPAGILQPETNYNFFANLSYSDMVRAIMKFISEEDPGAKVALVRNTIPFGKSPSAAAQQYAEKVGLEIREDDIVLELSASSAESQLRRAKQENIDWLIHQNVAGPHQVLLKDRQSVYPEVKVTATTWGGTEARVSQSAEIYEGTWVVNGFKTFQDIINSDVEAADILETVFENYRDAEFDDLEVANADYIRGFINPLTIAQGFQNAVDNGLDPTKGENVREGMFEINDWNAYGMASPITFTEDDRRAMMTGNMYQAVDGELKVQTTVELDRSLPIAVE